MLASRLVKGYPKLSGLFLPDGRSNDVVPWVMNTILAKHIVSQNRHVRQAACIWLLSLVKKLSQHKEIKVKSGVPKSAEDARGLLWLWKWIVLADEGE